MVIQSNEPPKFRQKSPNAPAYNLQECQEDARRIFRIEGQALLSRESIAEHLGLASQSGPFNRKLSSLRQYGFLDPLGKDFRVSDLFLRVDQSYDDIDRRRALREALGRPAIFQSLLTHYENSGIPSDLNLTNQLLVRYRFTKKNAETVAKAFLESCRLAGIFQNHHALLSPSAAAPYSGSDQLRSPEFSFSSPSSSSKLDTPALGNTKPSFCRQEIPLGLGRRATVELPEDVTNEEMSKIIRVLQALAGFSP